MQDGPTEAAEIEKQIEEKAVICGFAPSWLFGVATDYFSRAASC